MPRRSAHDPFQHWKLKVFYFFDFVSFCVVMLSFSAFGVYEAVKWFIHRILQV